MIRKIAISTAALLCAAGAGHAASTKIGDVFVIAMENQNSVVQGQNQSGLTPIYGNSAAPYINSLITPGNPNSANVSYSSAYHDIIYSGSSDLHPSEPNYIYQVSGLDSEPLTDNPPSQANNNVFSTSTPNLGQSLTSAGLTWKSYQEGIDTTGGNASGAVVTNTTAPRSQWTVPTQNFSGTNSSYVNPYNGSDQFNYAAKHNPFVFFQGDQQALNYAPLTQLSTDLTNNAVANFNWITPDQYNDMHSTLSTPFTYNGVTYYPSANYGGSSHPAAVVGNQENIAQGDNFLSIVVPEIEASQAFKDNGLIVIWTDEDEGDTPSTNANYSNMEILISASAIGDGYTNTVVMNHNTDLKTYLQIFGLSDAGYSTAVQNASTFGSLLQAGAVPEPSTWAMMLVGVGVIGGALRRRGKAALAAA
jgi:hypothetical protein